MIKAKRHWDYQWYAANDAGEYVMGFTDEFECRHYCNVNLLRPMTKGDARMSGRNPIYLENWTDDYPRNGVEGRIDI